LSSSIIHRNFRNKNKSVPLLATESSNNQNAILIITIYTSVDHSIGAIPMAERKLCANCVLVLMETFVG